MGTFRTWFLLWLALLLATPASTLAQETHSKEYEEALSRLTQKDFRKKAEAVAALERIVDSRTLEVFQAMLGGRLYYRKADKKLVTAEPTDDGYRITDVLTDEVLGTVAKRKLKKVSVNNQLRRTLRGAIARISLSSAEPAVRLRAAEQMAMDITAETASLLRQALEKEQDPSVSEAMRTTLALVEIESLDRATRIGAIKALKGSLHSEARNRLAALLKRNPDGTYVEAEEDVRRAATDALESIEFKLQLYGFAETTFFGLSLGSVLALAAIGLAITFGVMGVINMAHGELIMLGAYTTYVVQLLMPNYLDISLFVAIPAAFAVSGLFGIAIERGIIRFLYGRPLETLLATFGVSLILQQLVRSIFSPLNRSVATPSWMSGSVEISSALSLTLNRLYIIVFTILVFVVLLLILKKTVLGLQVRAVSQNRGMARAMGVRTEWVDAMTFGLGAGIAGVAGVALSQLTNVGPNLGQSYIVESFMVVVFGGVGNLWGTLIAGLSLGVANKFLEPFAGAVLAKILVLVFIIVFIQKRPRGLFPQKGRAAQS